MRKFDYDFLIDGKPVLAADEGIEISRSDLDSEDTGRDESGALHRIVLRERVKTWTLNYGHLTRDEYAYMLSLLEGKPTFEVTFRDISSEESTTIAYCSNDSISYVNRRTGLYKNFRIKIIEC